ncbi:MAG: hypothetical protein A3G35_04310 [candidate division NC10 bacterium RIFCSPLOWO2_12_FULL_66_18]|nr:MAG: hypothetical protein A3G35_04310 [candidate division NC10 bacterium RIFCSPLOWO2_12_FULL_66_18]
MRCALYFNMAPQPLALRCALYFNMAPQPLAKSPLPPFFKGGLKLAHMPSMGEGTQGVPGEGVWGHS